MIHHITRATRHLIFWSLLAVALGLTGVRLLLTAVDSYKVELAGQISELAGAPVTIGHIGAKMRGFSPELVLKNITLSSIARQSSTAPPEKPAIALQEIRLGVDLLDMLLKRELLPSMWVSLVGTKLTLIRQADGHIAIEGLKEGDNGQPFWLLQGSRFEILNSVITWQDELKKAKPLTLEPVDMAIINQGERHKLNLLVKLQHKKGDRLRLSMDVSGNVFEPAAVNGKLFVEGKNIDLAHWGMLDTPLPFTSKAGEGDLKLWAEIKNSRLVSINGDVALRGLKINQADQRSYAIQHLESQFCWEFDERLGHIVRATLNLESNDKVWPKAVFSVSAKTAQDGLMSKMAMYIEQMDLEEAASIAEFFAPLSSEQSATLSKANLKGSLERFALFTDLSDQSFAVNGEFNELSIDFAAPMPGFSNLSGSLKGTDKLGAVRLTTENASLTSADLFRKTLAIDTLKGVLNWRQTPEAWQLSSSLLEMNSQSFKSKSRLQVSMPKNAEPVFMDLQSSFTGDDVSQVVDYLPTGIMDKAVVEWLDYAFVSGQIRQGGFLFSGNLNDFPFKKGEGVFEVLFDVDQLELAYYPEWPHLTGLVGEVLFFKDQLQVNLTQGQSQNSNVNIKQALVTIDSFHDSNYLAVKGELEGEIGQALDFLQKTPLNLPVDALLNAVEPKGSTQVSLDLKIPLTQSFVTKVNGTAKLTNAKLRVKALDLQVSKINGDLNFTEQGVYSKLINAEALAYPIQINIDSNKQQTTVYVDGRAGIPELEQQFKMPIWHLAKGATDYQLQLKLPYGDESPLLQIESVLAGVELSLPESLAKSRESKRPLSLTFNLSNAEILPISLVYDNQLKATFALDIKKQQLYSGHILAGDGVAIQREAPGVKLELNHDRLALNEWLALGAAFESSEDKSGAAARINEIKVHSDHGLWKKTDLGAVDLTMKLDGSAWAGALNSTMAKGQLKVPDNLQGDSRIQLDLDQLNLWALKQLNFSADSSAPRPQPETMPLISINSKKTLWNAQDLGVLRLDTERSKNGIDFKTISVTGDSLKFNARGNWKVNGVKSQTRFQGHLDAPKAGALLSQLEIRKDLSETTAAIDFAVNWDGAPQQFSLAGLQGSFDIDLKNGRILSIEPGFGRVLGVLAMAQWIKRLQLDFGDVYKEGLTFNTIKGHFDLFSGKALTNDLVVDAIPAKISISGDTDLVKHQIDHIVKVAPKSADAVPIAGTIMGKVTTLIARTLTGKDQEGFFFGSQYQVKGSWEDVQVIPLHERDGLLQKTWTGLTDFSWINQK